MLEGKELTWTLMHKDAKVKSDFMSSASALICVS